MADFPGFTIWTDAYLGDTIHLTTLEHGAYLLLLMTMWRAGGHLPNDDKKLAKYARLTPAQWARIKPTLMEFFTVEGDQITQRRLTAELSFVKQRSAKQSDNAKAKYRKTLKAEPAMAQPNASQTPAPTLTPTLEEDTSLRSVAPPAPKKRGTRLSAEWALPKDYGEWALAKGLTRDRILIEAEKMKNWSINAGKNGVKIDWFAAWRNWVQKAIDDSPRSSTRPMTAIEERTSRLRERISDGYGIGREGSGDHQVDERFPLLIENH